MAIFKEKLNFNHVDYSGNYKLSTLFTTLATLATQNAMEIGMWNEDMRSSYGWVVAKQTMKLEEPIRVDDCIEITTCIDKGSFVTFPRNYYIKKEERIVGTVSAIWTLIDIEKRNIVAPKRVGLVVPDIKCDMPLDTPKTVKEDIELELVSQRKVMYSDLDVNQHMNNARYLEWACDLIDLDLYREYYIKEASINYKKEIKPASIVNLYIGKNTDRFIIKGVVEEETAFILELFFCKR